MSTANRKTLRLSVKSNDPTESTLSDIDQSSLDLDDDTTLSQTVSESQTQSNADQPTKPTPKRATTRTLRVSKAGKKTKNLPTTPPGELSAIRQKMLKKFTDIFPENQDQIVKDCEKELYMLTCQTTHAEYPDNRFISFYLNKGLNLIRNLDPTSSIKNTYLQPKVLSGEISPNQLVVMPDQELYPPKWQKIKDRQLQDISVQTEEKVVTTSMYVCFKCNQAKCTYFQRQTRSSDEQTTTFITCLNCGNHWRD